MTTEHGALRYGSNCECADLELLAELEVWRAGRGPGHLAVDPPSLRSPRVAGSEDGGVPVWVCSCCVALTVAAAAPSECLGCGQEDVLGETLYPGVLVDRDGPERLLGSG